MTNAVRWAAEIVEEKTVFVVLIHDDQPWRNSKALRVCLVKSLWNNKIIYLRIRYDKSLFPPSPFMYRQLRKRKNSKTKGASESCARILRAESTTENLETRSHGEGKFQFPRFQSERRDRFPIASCSLSLAPADGCSCLESRLLTRRH